MSDVYLPDGFQFWSKETDKVNIINPSDFPKEDILGTVGIDSENVLFDGVGNVDPEEARERIAVMRFLYRHPEIRDLAHKIAHKTSPLPRWGQDYRDYYHPNRKHNPFWEEIHRLRSLIKGKELAGIALPKRIREFFNILDKNLSLEQEERLMVEKINERLETSALVEGIAEISINGTGNIAGIEFPNFFGHRTFSFSLSSLTLMEHPEWAKKALFKGWIGKWVCNIIDRTNEKAQKEAYESMNLDRVHLDSLDGDMRKNLIKVIEKKHPRFFYELKTSAIFPNNGVTLVIAFSYGHVEESCTKAFRFRIVSVEIPQLCMDASLSTTGRVWDGYDQEKRESINRERDANRELIKRFVGRVIGASVMNSIKNKIGRKNFDAVFSDIFEMDTPDFSYLNCWDNLQNIYALPEIDYTHKRIIAFRSYIEDLLKVLAAMGDVVQKISVLADKCKTSLSFSEITESEGNIVSFDALYPMHLVGAVKAKKIVPVNNLPPINGKMIGLTGYHGGGKTVTEHTVATAVYLAQSGIPVLGRKFRCNPKKIIGLVFIEGIKGRSVIQVLLEKTTNIFEAIKDVPGKDILIILDELGSATQQEDGFELAKKILANLKRRKVSLMFSTQILNVANYAKENFGARCFKVDPKHHLKEGITGGGLADAIRNSGLGKYLK